MMAQSNDCVSDVPPANPWKANVLAGFLVFLIALPLCLAIANASYFPPVAGVITAIIGGLLTPWISNSQMTIKGPAAGLIVIVAGCALSFGWAPDNPAAQMHAYRCTLAVTVAAGLVQVAFALLRTGVVSEMFPTTVVHGMLAAIGIIIISKQSHILLGTTPTSKEPLELLLEIPHSLLHMNPAIAAIGVSCLAVLVAWPFVKNARLKRVPAPLLVVCLSIGMAGYLGLENAHQYSWIGSRYDLSEKFLVSVPSSLLSAITFPDFSELLTANGLVWVMMFCLIGSLESILSAKAIDLLDPAKRRTNFDRDLMAVGIANVAAGCLGGLPMISEIVRSRANIDSGAKNRFANLFHGLFLLLFLALAPGLLHRIPLAALAAMLVYTGFRLASPKEFLHMYKLGLDQLVVFVGTVVAVLATDLLIGIVVGACLEIGEHLLRGISWKALWRPSLELEQQDGQMVVKSQDSAVFTTWLRLKKCLTQCSPTERVVLDLSGAAIVDHTVLSKLEDLRRDWSDEGRHLHVTGLDYHLSTSTHPLSCRHRVITATESSLPPWRKLRCSPLHSLHPKPKPGVQAMTETHPTKTPNFIRDQFILTVILIAALVCRNSFERPTTSPTEVAKQPASASVEPTKLADAR